MPLRNSGINDNHSVAYCLLSYYCAYYRYHYPLEFIVSFLNNAMNADDIENASVFAKNRGFRIVSPKWGEARSEYSFNKETNSIYKGLASIKYISNGLAEQLYELSKAGTYERFVDVLLAIEKSDTVSIDSRQLDILIKIDFFSQFGNQRELLRIVDLFSDLFKSGNASKISKAKVEDSPLKTIIEKYAVGVTKANKPAASWTLLDIESILREVEGFVHSLNLTEIPLKTRCANFRDVMGYDGYTTGREEDRCILSVSDIYPLCRKKDGKQFGYSFITQSVGSGKKSRFTVFNTVFNKQPVNKGDLIICKGWEREGQYFKMTAYEMLL